MKKIFTYLKTVFQGFLMGIAAIIPGVSSGTVAVLLKFYDKLIEAVDTIVSLKKGLVAAGLFVVLIYGGNFIALFTLAGPMNDLLENFPNEMKLFFIGLIIGSMPLIINKIQEQGKTNILQWKLMLPFLLSAGFLILLNVFTGEDTNAEPIRTLTLGNSFLIFFTGLIASATAIIPGVSGSMVQLAIGMYPTFTYALEEFNIPILIVLFFGMALGLVFAAKLISFLLKHAYHVTYATIVGLLVGSVFQILPKLSGGESTLNYVIFVIVLGLGFCLAYASNAFDTKKKDLKNKIKNEEI
jgi:putative membrane protein